LVFRSPLSIRIHIRSDFRGHSHSQPRLPVPSFWSGETQENIAGVDVAAPSSRHQLALRVLGARAPASFVSPERCDQNWLQSMAPVIQRPHASRRVAAVVLELVWRLLVSAASGFHFLVITTPLALHRVAARLLRRRIPRPFSAETPLDPTTTLVANTSAAVADWTASHVVNPPGNRGLQRER